jgi:Fe2+ or Zn2+ uptake regulation protein
MNNISDPLKLRCVNHHTFFRYDVRGIHLWCRHCKTVREVPWEELQQMYRQTREASTSEQRVLY